VTPARVRFSVSWTGNQRVILVCAFAFFAVITLGWVVLTWNPAFAGDPSQRDDLWVARAIIVVFIAPCLLLLGILRRGIWLDGQVLVRQHLLWRTRINLATGRFGMTQTRWNYTRRLGALNLTRITVVAPTLVVRASWLRRIRLPLAARTGHEVVAGRVVVAWLPPAELEALAEAIERYATAPNTAQVATFLRNVHRSPVQPGGSLESPYP
jgi:hypothetical protein